MSDNEPLPVKSESRKLVITVVRVVWVAVQLALVYCVGEKGALFFYQTF